MRGKLYDLIAANFGKATFYTAEERERYGGVTSTAASAYSAARTSPMILACARRTCA